jgi:transcriptional regulator with XRE-family HTH domain
VLRGDRIRELREKQGMSQRVLAERIGRHQVDISRLESGKLQHITIETLEKLSDLFGVSADYLLGRTDESETAPAALVAVAGQPRAGEKIEAYVNAHARVRA